jgi:glycosyltransferase involved in cell wall biosynthesis
MKLSLCITTYNRYKMTMKSFARVLDDNRISEIVIVDDCSEMEYYDKLAAETIDMPKVRLIRNERNLGMSLNKKKAIDLAKSDWCIIFDSDNIIYPSYLDALQLRVNILKPDVIYCPDFAKPQFDYRKFGGLYIENHDVRHFISQPMAEPVMNTCNYVVNRKEYLKIYQHNPEMKGTDTIWFNYLWLSAGNSFYVVPGMEYQHRVHPGSGWLQDADYNMKKAKEVKELIKKL